MENLSDEVLKIIISLVAGAVIGAEREYKTKAAGFRTIILITLGSTIFTIISLILGGDKDPARIASNILTGIGFIGAGVIFKEGAFVKGITTASVIWVSAAIGVTIGIGRFDLAAISVVLVILVLLGFTWVQNIIDKTNANRVYKIILRGNNETKIRELEAIFKSCSVKAKCTNWAKNSNEIILTYKIQGPEKGHEQLIKEFYGNSLVESFEV